MGSNGQETDLIPYHERRRRNVVDKFLLQPGSNKVVSHRTMALQQLGALLDEALSSSRERMAPELTKTIFPAGRDDRRRPEYDRKFLRNEVLGIVSTITVRLQVFGNLRRAERNDDGQVRSFSSHRDEDLKIAPH
ncbi:hypothetical protein D3C85_882450 [compost metagenome]